MNLRSRLSKLERQTRVNNEFCHCYGIAPKLEVIPITIDEWKRRITGGEPTAEKLPDYCRKCRKPVDKSNLTQTFEEYREIRRNRLKQAEAQLAKFEN